MKIKVLANNIKQGKPRSTTHCPVALAIKREFPLARKHGISVRLRVVSRWGDYNWNGVRMVGVSKFIKRFDEGSPVEPIEFELKTTREKFNEYLKETNE